ncbi:MAG TPA: hypothetical protein VGC10_10010, partial [Sphingomonas sp.]
MQMLAVAAFAAVVLLAWLAASHGWFGRHGDSAGNRKLTMDEARALNATIPFVAGRPIPAPPFPFHG